MKQYCICSYEEVNRELATDVTSVAERNELRFPHYIFTKKIAEQLGVKMNDLPPYIGIRGRTPVYYIEKLKDLPRQIAERQAEDEEDLPELERRIIQMERRAAGKD